VARPYAVSLHVVEPSLTHPQRQDENVETTGVLGGSAE
jgi:hypothetical protein